MDDEFDSIDFFAIDKLVENHQAKLQVRLVDTFPCQDRLSLTDVHSWLLPTMCPDTLQVSQAAPVSPYGKTPHPGTAAQAPSGAVARPPTAAPQPQQQPQQQWQRPTYLPQQPQPAVTANLSTYSRQQHPNAQVHQQPPSQHAPQQTGQNQPGMHHGRQQPPSQPSIYTGPKPTSVSTSGAPLGRVSQAAAAALGRNFNLCIKGFIAVNHLAVPTASHISMQRHSLLLYTCLTQQCVQRHKVTHA